MANFQTSPLSSKQYSAFRSFVLSFSLPPRLVTPAALYSLPLSFGSVSSSYSPSHRPVLLRQFLRDSPAAIRWLWWWSLDSFDTLDFRLLLYFSSSQSRFFHYLVANHWMSFFSLSSCLNYSASDYFSFLPSGISDLPQSTFHDAVCPFFSRRAWGHGGQWPAP